MYDNMMITLCTYHRAADKSPQTQRASTRHLSAERLTQSLTACIAQSSVYSDMPIARASYSSIIAPHPREIAKQRLVRNKELTRETDARQRDSDVVGFIALRVVFGKVLFTDGLHYLAYSTV